MEKISAPNGRVFMKFDIWIFFEYLSRKLKFHSNLARLMGTSHKDYYTLITSRSVRLGMRNVSERNCKENQNICFMYENLFPKIVTFMR